MDDLLERIGALPIGMAVVLLTLIVLVRSHGTYWAARGVVRGTQAVHERADSPQWYRATFERIDRWTSSNAARKGLDLVRRWGWPAITVAYLTIGLQTAIFAAAGLIKMPYLRFTLASIPGAIAWAVVWSTIGFAVFFGALTLFAHSPWLAFGVLALLILLGGWIWRRRLERHARQDPEAEAVSPE